MTNQLFIERNQDNQELDDYTRQVVLERDRERLKKMTFYVLRMSACVIISCGISANMEVITAETVRIV